MENGCSGWAALRRWMRRWIPKSNSAVLIASLEPNASHVSEWQVAPVNMALQVAINVQVPVSAWIPASAVRDGSSIQVKTPSGMQERKVQVVALKRRQSPGDRSGIPVRGRSDSLIHFFKGISFPTHFSAAGESFFSKISRWRDNSSTNWKPIRPEGKIRHREGAGILECGTRGSLLKKYFSVLFTLVLFR